MSSRSSCCRCAGSSWSMTARTRSAKSSTRWRSRLPRARSARSAARLVAACWSSSRWRCGDRGGAALQFGHVDQPGLVEVDEPAAFAVGRRRVLRSRRASSAASSSSSGIGACDRDGLLAGQQQVGVAAGRRGSGRRRTRRGRRRGCCVRGSAGPGRRRAAGRGCGSSSSGARCRCGRASCGSWCPTPQAPHLTRPRSSQCAGFGAARAPFGVVAADLAGGLERLVVDDGRAGDRDPLVAGAGHLPGALAGPAVRDGLGAVEVDPADVGLVAQQPADGRGAPDRRVCRSGWARRRR